ncbi:hypothetical protein U728_348 [Clostridium botulinum 202F]|nr:hypothetical protein U728_348 [Clostridium botulinum 202F]KAI3345745.1 hypothetical protein CIT17_11795 [Clostridium botulinum]KON12228.1 hypothetical protein ACP50_09845 [Clostridium botulinum]MBY6985305.1 hypothetical protein [Clostridium botulinum]NFF24330.1 hypothetical protein [Clostridium botulinum]
MFNELNICNIDFNTITDYVILISYLLKCINTSKTEIKKFISDFENIVNQFYQDNAELCNKILSTDTKNKLQLLRNFI